MKFIKQLLFSIFLLQSLFTYAHGFKVLVFTKTAGFRHASIPDGITMIQQLGTMDPTHQFTVTTTEDANDFTFDNLKQYEAVIFLSTTGDVLNNTQQGEFEMYIRNGGGFVGIHAASDTEFSWPWYEGLVGAYFKNHPSGTPTADIKVSDRVHPSTKDLPTTWTRTDEWYNFQTNPRGQVHVLATLDETTYTGGDMGFDHPIAWCHEYDGGRSWYTAGGHTSASYSDTNFRKHVLGGILYAVGEVTGNFEATVENNFEVSVIDNNPTNAIALEILPDLKVMYIERGGNVKLYNPTNGQISTIATFDVDSNREDGLIGITLDPNFSTNNYVYLFYSPTGTENKQNVSRLTFNGSILDRSTEKILLEIPTQRSQCCHSGGDMEFDTNGNLYISVGDNTNPFASSGYTPIDERGGRSAWDAQGTSSNTKDFRGKILRITPQNDGTYTIPSGNLFTNPNDGFPEIYAMGVRNPYRMTVSPDGYLYFGDVGPDATNDSGRGPRGHDEFNRTNTAANFGWPYCIADNKRYGDYNFATGTTGSLFNCDTPVNNSPNNNGLTSNLPISKPAWMWYANGNSAEFPALSASGGRTAMVGEVYEFNSSSTSEIKFPEYFNNSIFIYEWSRNWIREVKLDDSGNILSINPFLENLLSLNRPIDMTFGPDGAMYIIEWGTGFQGNNANARIIKIAYKQGNQAPTAIATASPTSGSLPLTVNFDASGSSDAEGGNLTYDWDFNGDGVFDDSGITATNTYTTAGNFNAQLRVTDNEGSASFTTIEIVAGNNAPVITINSPVNGGFFDSDEEIEFQISATDTEDGIINCNQIKGLPSIGHDDHIHDENEILNCEGSFTTQSHGDDADNVFYVFRGSYQDNGANGVNPITGSASIILQPKRKEAEHYSSQQGIQTENTTDVLGGGINLGFIQRGDYISFTPMSLENIQHITFRAASNGAGGFVEARLDSPTGTLIGKRFLPVTNGWQNWDFFTMPITETTGTHELFFVFENPNSTGFLFNLNWIEFHGKGIVKVDKNASSGLAASYYNNTTFSGTPTIIRDPFVGFNWSGEKPNPAINADNFSVRWQGKIKIEETKNFTFRTQHQNGSVKVSINNTEILNSSTAGANTSSAISLMASQEYPLVVEYIHTTGNASVSFEYGVNNTVHFSDLLVDETILSIEDFEKNTDDENNISIYPNPFTNEITISMGALKNRDYSIKVFDTLGKMLLQQDLLSKTDNYKLNLSNLSNGVYFLEIENQRTTVYKKIVKQ